MEVQVREICNKCFGTGKNGLSDEAALERVRTFPAGGVLGPGQIAPPSLEQRARAEQACGYCENGYNRQWVELNELLSMGL